MHSVNERSLVILPFVHRVMLALDELFFVSRAVIISGYMVNDCLIAQSSGHSPTAYGTDAVLQRQNKSQFCSQWINKKFTYALSTCWT